MTAEVARLPRLGAAFSNWHREADVAVVVMVRFFAYPLVRPGLFVEEAGTQGHQALQATQHLLDENLDVILGVVQADTGC